MGYFELCLFVIHFILICINHVINAYFEMKKQKKLTLLYTDLGHYAIYYVFLPSLLINAYETCLWKIKLYLQSKNKTSHVSE